MDRRHFLGRTIGIAVGIGFLSVSIAQVANMNDAINKAGRQRMLSQRLAKAYLQVGQAIDVQRSQRILDTSLSMFDRQLVELRAFAPTADNKQLLSEMEKSWLGFKAVLVGKSPNQQDARNIMAINEEILAMANSATLQLEKYSGTSSGQLVNTSGRQRMLSQRMAKFYQAKNWGVAPADVSTKLELARKEFITGMQFLENAPANTPGIRDKLLLAQQQWMFFDSALQQSGSIGNHPQYAVNVATTSERILEIMDEITGLYQQLS